jgi:hypothetical protein
MALLGGNTLPIPARTRLGPAQRHLPGFYFPNTTNIFMVLGAICIPQIHLGPFSGWGYGPAYEFMHARMTQICTPILSCLGDLQQPSTFLLCMWMLTKRSAAA